MSMCLNVVRTAIEMNNFMHVQNYVSKAEQTPDVQVRGLDGGKAYEPPLAWHYF